MLADMQLLEQRPGTEIVKSKLLSNTSSCHCSDAILSTSWGCISSMEERTSSAESKSVIISRSTFPLPGIKIHLSELKGIHNSAELISVQGNVGLANE